MNDASTPALSSRTLSTIASSIDAFREEAWDMTKAMDIRLEAFQRNVDKSDGSDLSALSDEALRISAYARRAYEAGKMEPSVSVYEDTSALLDPRGYDRALQRGTVRDFRYDPERVEVSAADRKIIESPRPIVERRGPEQSELAPAQPHRGAGR